MDKMVALSASIVFADATPPRKASEEGGGNNEAARWRLHEVLVKGIKQGASKKKHKPEKYR